MIKMIETDKSRDVRRGGSRFSRQIKQSGLKLISGLNGVAVGDFVSFEKSNKERIKKLSEVNRAIFSSHEENYEMGCDIADREEVLPSQTPPFSGSGTNKRFKLPRKQFFDDCNGVDHVSVPRKLRSAMKKRNRESISPPLPDSKKLNYSTNGVESPKRVGVKKSKLNLKQGAPNWSLKESAGGPITQDEEEVVETLFALAGMFPDNEPDCNNKLDSASLDASPSALPEAGESQPPKLEDSISIKEDLNVICISRTDEDVDPTPEIERSLEETTKVCPLNGPSIQESSDFPSSKKLHGELDSSVAQVNLHKAVVKNEEQKLTCNSVSLCFPPGLHQDIGKLNQQAKLEISLLDRKPETAPEQTTEIGSQLDKQHALDESKNKGPALWPGLSSTVSSSASHGPLSQSCAAKIPAWLGTRPGSFQNGSSTGKVSEVPADRRSWKRCAAHVYISHLIRALQMPESKESLPILPNQLRPREILNQGVLMTINEFNGIRNNLNGVACASRIGNSGEKNSNDNKNGILQHLRPLEDNSQAALSSGAYPSHKQSFNFLSLSAGGGGIESNNSFNGTGNLEPLAQLQVPYHAQHPTFIPLSMSQTLYTSAYHDQPSAAAAAVQQAQIQLPSHLSSPYCVPHPSPKALTKKPQQQQRLGAVQLAAQYRNTGTSTAMTQFPSWQNGRQDSSVLMPCIPSLRSTIEVLGPNYPQISQQQLMAIALPHARAKRQDHHISSVYEETGVGFLAGGGALPLQLLCNERL